MDASTTECLFHWCVYIFVGVTYTPALSESKWPVEWHGGEVGNMLASISVYLTASSPIKVRPRGGRHCGALVWEAIHIYGFNFISDPSKLEARHFNTSLEEASYDATSTTCPNPIPTRRNSRNNTLASTTRNSKRHTYNLRARKINTG